MDVQDQSNHTNPSGHESHVVHLCHRCGWPFPNPHPSAKHRRAHKKICGTIEGYTTLIDSEAVSDDEHHLDDDKEKTPSPKIEKKSSVGDSGGTGGRASRSEEDFFSDAVTEFSDSGVEDRSASRKSLDRDLFFSFKDAENAGTNEVLDSSTEISKVEANVMVSENVEKTRETEITTVCDQDGKSSTGLVKDGVVESQEAESIDVVKAGEEKVQESLKNEELDVPSETVTEEAKNLEVQASETSKMTPEILAFVGEKLESATKDEIIEENKQEKFKSDCESVSEIRESEFVHDVEGNSEEITHEKSGLDHEHGPEAAKESEIDRISEEIKHEKPELDHEHGPEAAKESEIDRISEEIKHEKSELDHEHGPEAAKESEIDQKKVEGVSEVIKHEKFESDHEHASEAVKEPEVVQSFSVSTEKEDLGAPESEKCTSEQAQEVSKEPNTFLTESEELGAAESQKCSNKNTQEVVEEPDSVLIETGDLGAPKSENCLLDQTPEVVRELKSVASEKDDLDAPKPEECLNKQTLDVVAEPDTLFIEKQDLGAPKSEKSSNEHNPEVVQKPDTVLIQKEDLGASILPEKEEIGASNAEKCNEHIQEVIKEPKGDDNSETIMPKEANQLVKDIEHASDNSIADVKIVSGVVSEPIVEEGTGKPMTNQDSVADISVDSSSRNSLEGNWGSVSVLSTASIDAETVHSKVNSGKPATADVFEPPSFMTLVEPNGKDQKPASADDRQEPPKPEASQAGWFPTLTNVNNESEGRKRNEEVIAKVTNWSTAGKHSMPLKSLLGEAKSPNAKQPESVTEKDEGAAERASEAAEVNQEVSSPLKLIEDGKKGKKVKGRGSWMPFVCCSSVNVN